MDIHDKRKGGGGAASSYTSATLTAAAEPPPKPLRGGPDADGEMGQRQRRQLQRRREIDLCVPDLQVPTRNKGLSYYYFTTAYCCWIFFSSSSVQTSNFTAPPIVSKAGSCILK